MLGMAGDTVTCHHRELEELLFSTATDKIRRLTAQPTSYSTHSPPLRPPNGAETPPTLLSLLLLLRRLLLIFRGGAENRWAGNVTALTEPSKGDTKKNNDVGYLKATCYRFQFGELNLISTATDNFALSASSINL